MSVDIGSIAMNNEPKTGLTDFSEKVVCFYRGSLSSSKNASVALQEWRGGVAVVAVTDTRNISCFSGVQCRVVKSFKAYKVLQFFQWFLLSDETFVSKVPMDGNEMD